jgi:hypothetical protein
MAAQKYHDAHVTWHVNRHSADDNFRQLLEDRLSAATDELHDAALWQCGTETDMKASNK